MSESVQKLNADLRAAAKTLTTQEARYLVDAYYIIQEDRKRSSNQVRSMKEEPNEMLRWFFDQNVVLENNIKISLDCFSDAHPVGKWAKSVYGIGPVIAAGLLAHIDITQAPTVGHIWRFAGLDPSRTWEKGQKRPWNAQLKTLCWHIGQSFMKFSNRDACFYGKLYKEKKEFYVAKNDAGDYAERAKTLAPKFSTSTDAYKHLTAGKLPPAHIDAMARRWVVKLFLSHLHYVWWKDATGEPPPKPYVITHLGHVHEILPPNI
jgi:hypothetical protein